MLDIYFWLFTHCLICLPFAYIICFIVRLMRERGSPLHIHTDLLVLSAILVQVLLQVSSIASFPSGNYKVPVRMLLKLL